MFYIIVEIWEKREISTQVLFTLAIRVQIVSLFLERTMIYANTRRVMKNIFHEIDETEISISA